MAPPYKDPEKRKEAQRKARAKRHEQLKNDPEYKEKNRVRAKAHRETYDDKTNLQRVRRHRAKNKIDSFS